MANRINGDWITLNVDKAVDVAMSVADQFAANTYSHSIVFTAPKGAYELYDHIKIRVNNKIYTSYISTVTKTKGTELAEYKSGELQVQFPFLERI